MHACTKVVQGPSPQQSYIEIELSWAAHRWTALYAQALSEVVQAHLLGTLKEQGGHSQLSGIKSFQLGDVELLQAIHETGDQWLGFWLQHCPCYQHALHILEVKAWKYTRTWAHTHTHTHTHLHPHIHKCIIEVKSGIYRAPIYEPHPKNLENNKKNVKITLTITPTFQNWHNKDGGQMIGIALMPAVITKQIYISHILGLLKL